MVLFDEHRVVQADAVVGAAAHAHGVFLRQAQAGQGLARVHDVGARALHSLDVGGGLGGHGAEQLQEIQRRALRAQQRAGTGFDLQHHLIRCAALALGHVPGDARSGVERAQRGVGPGSAADHRAFAREHAGAGATHGIDQASGQITAAHVFLQGARHVQQHLGMHRIVGGVSKIGHGRKHSGFD